jgi:cobalamin biosynthesis protein CobT
MSDATSKDTTDAEEAGKNSATKAKGRREKELNEQAAEHQAEEKRAEQEAEALEQGDKPEQPTDPEQLRGEIAEAREELGETVEALAAKADVKGRAKDTVYEQKARARAKLDEVTEQVKEKPAPVAAVAGGVVTLLLLVLVLLRRRRRR